uniref:Uncharacterized protein n=1 Tax=Rhizophora mucronata TaxID=61149 RepID=A0A2P2NHY9_RHIMU
MFCLVAKKYHWQQKGKGKKNEEIKHNVNNHRKVFIFRDLLRILISTLSVQPYKALFYQRNINKKD